jgi:hypothetical protein
MAVHCTVQVVERERQHKSATSPWARGGRHLTRLHPTRVSTQVHVFQMFLDLEERAADALAALGAHVRSCTADTRDTKVLSSSTNATK